MMVRWGSNLKIILSLTLVDVKLVLQSKLSDLGIQKGMVAETFKLTYFMQKLGNGRKSLAPKLLFLFKQYCYNNGRKMLPYLDNERMFVFPPLLMKLCHKWNINRPYVWYVFSTNCQRESISKFVFLYIYFILT